MVFYLKKELFHLKMKNIAQTLVTFVLDEILRSFWLKDGEIVICTSDEHSPKTSLQILVL